MNLAHCVLKVSPSSYGCVIILPSNHKFVIMNNLQNHEQKDQISNGLITGKGGISRWASPLNVIAAWKKEFFYEVNKLQETLFSCWRPQLLNYDLLGMSPLATGVSISSLFCPSHLFHWWLQRLQSWSVTKAPVVKRALGQLSPRAGTPPHGPNGPFEFSRTAPFWHWRVWAKSPQPGNVNANVTFDHHSTPKVTFAFAFPRLRAVSSNSPLHGALPNPSHTPVLCKILLCSVIAL